MGSTDSIQSATRTRLTTATAIRLLTGYNNARDASDAAIEADIDRAQSSVVGLLSNRVHDMPLWGAIDGSNTRFSLPHGDNGSMWNLPGGRNQPSRVIVDADLNLASDAADVKVFLLTPATDGGPPTYTEATVASVDGVHGQITLSSAPATTVTAVTLTARIVARAYDEDELKTAVELLASHYVDQKAREAGKLNLANPSKEPKGAGFGSGSDWLGLFDRHMSRLMAPKPRAASKRVSMPRGGAAWRQPY